MNQDIRIIKRYANRRMYDTGTSRYVTIDEIQELVLKHVKFKIIDDTTDEDLTHYILLQIIMTQEKGRVPFFSIEVLENIIRFYGNPLQNAMSQFLEKSFSVFDKQKPDYQSYMKKNAFEVMANLTKQNLDIWQSTVSDYFNQDAKKPTKKAKRKKDNSG